ncbi:MAG: type II 3-dehydroquinate dehydratase [Anaerovoracaceae bacterium]|jgi:3-dehydroquinate dehydratase-2|nr:type II 3-dehydroquinate dehydratase [Anaerovoracaceae bacterium]
MKIWVINGPNINLLGQRETEIYGHKTYRDLIDYIEEEAYSLDIDVECFQSNHEGILIDWIHAGIGKVDGLIINAGGYTHTSIALMDAVKGSGITTVEVHISNPKEREGFRKISYLSMVASKTIEGKGFEGYKEALQWLRGNRDQEKR